MRFGTEARRNVSAAAISALALTGVLLIDAMGRFDSQVNSARPRELTNQEPCWTAENPDDISRCELDD
jgi:hypothetical protein